MTTEMLVSKHYTHGRLADTILDAARTVKGISADLEPQDLAPVDEFHIGGRAATEHFLPQLGLAKGMEVLDVGSGIGGTARFAAERFGCRVQGIDLTAEYCDVGNLLSQKVGLGELARFRQASALAMPFEDGCFDAAYTVHVAMNIEDKAALYREVYRVLRPGAVFGVYDLLATPAGGELSFPVPWATTPETSFLATPDEMLLHLNDAGFVVERRTERTDFALDFFKTLRAQSESGPPVLGMHLLMGESFGEKAANMIQNVADGKCGPWEMICRRP